MHELFSKGKKMFLGLFSIHKKNIFSLTGSINKAIFTVFVSIFLVWFLAEFVFAEKEANVYIFPSVVTSEGWESPILSLAQDLSHGAELVDFNRENSAYVYYANEADDVVELDLSTSTLDDKGNDVPPDFIDETIVGNTGDEIVNSLIQATTSSWPTEQIGELANPAVPELTFPGLLAPVAPSILDVLIPNLPEGVTATGTTTGVSPIEVVTPQSTGTQAGLLNKFFEFAKFYTSPKRALALDTPSSTVEHLRAQELLYETELHPDTATTSEIFSRDSNTDGVATSSEYVPPETTLTPSSENSDPFSVALCTTLGKKCHVIEYAGFGLGVAMEGKTVLSANLEISLAGRGAFSGTQYDRVLVRAYHAGRWEHIGEVVVRGDLSNGKRGGYFTFPIDFFSDWSDLTDLKIAIEYDRESEEDASVYVDGIWVNARYSSDLTDDETPEQVALSAANLRSSLSAKDAEARRARRDLLVLPEGEVVAITHSDKHADAKLVVKTNKEIYHALGTARSYFSVTNDGTAPEETRLQFHFSDDTARVSRLSRFVHNVPHNVGEPTIDDIGYFCDSGWARLGDEAMYRCESGGELRACDRLNTDRTNCITENARVGKTLGVSYRDMWKQEPFLHGSIEDSRGIFANAITRLFAKMPDNAIAPTLVPVAHTAESVLIQPGQTIYFRADIEVPLNGRGDFTIETMAPSGEFGLVHSGWSGSWNHKFPVTIDTTSATTDEDLSVSISLKNAPAEFWELAQDAGGDVRVVDGEEIYEAPYALVSWNKELQSGLLHALLRNINQGTSTVAYVYFGDANASSQHDSHAPFRSRDLTPRGLMFGGSQTDMSLHVVAMDEETRVRVGEELEHTLKKGESIIFEKVVPGSVLYADGPVTANIETLSPVARYVPMGYAGGEFVLPKLLATDDVEYELSLGLPVQEEAHATIDFQGGTEGVDPVFASVVKRPIVSSESVVLTTDLNLLATIAHPTGIPSRLYPATSEELYGFALAGTQVAAGRDGTNFTALCGGGARQEVDGRRKGVVTTLDRCQGGTPELTDSMKLSGLTRPLSAYTNFSNDYISFLPKNEFSNLYTSPSESVGILLLCAPEDGAMNIAAYDPEGGIIASSTCSGYGTRPGKTYLTPSRGLFPSGYTVRSIATQPAPFLAYAVTEDIENSGKGTMRASPLISPSLSRGYGSVYHDIVIGPVEFVIPGEHRRLDVTEDGRDKIHVDTLLTKNREFSIHELPKFRFSYKRQSNSILQNVRDFLGDKPFVVKNIMLKHPLFGDTPIEHEVFYAENNEWSLDLKPHQSNGTIRPGKYTLHIEIEEAGKTYTDEFDFFWGVLAINYTKSIYTPGEKVDIAMGALSDNGNTICDANLRLWITDMSGVESEVPVSISGKCYGNNVVDVPDYTATYQLASNATGTYRVRLVRFDEQQNVASQVTDQIEVRSSVPYVIERYGPTRIYPLAHYPMKIRVRANEAFTGSIIERIPGDYVVIDRGNANLEWGDAEHTFITATWPVTLAPGAFIDLEYVFDPADRSPYLYLLGPILMKSDASEFVEAREWQIASDAVGNMLIYFENSLPMPTGWTCVSCVPTDTFFERFAYGSSTYGELGGTATHTPTALATVDVTGSTGVGPNTTNNTTNAPLAHTHTLTPQISSVSNLPAYKNLRVIQSNSAGDPVTIPAGAIGMFDVASSSLPIGWYRYAPLDGLYVQGASSTASGGANTHTHTATGTLAAPVQSGLRTQGGVLNGSVTATHVHTLSSTSTNSVNHEPPYAEVLFAKLNTASATPNYLIAMWNDTPSDGWSTISGPGGDLERKFLKASTTYGGGGGLSSHAHASISGATTSQTTTLSSYNVNANNAQAPAAHTHPVLIDGFSDDSHLPKYVGVIFAKRLTGISVLTQDSYRLYANANTLTPTDPWPSAGSDLNENSPIDSSNISIIPGDEIRLRMNVFVTNATATVSTHAYKLQYVAASDCVNALNWTDVGAIGSGGLWRGYNNTSVANNATIGSLLLSSSTILESYVEENPSIANPTEIPLGGVGEWDWVLSDNLAVGGTTYCFRMVHSDGTPLDGYDNYPQILTNAQPQQSTLSVPFKFEKVGTTTPGFQFFASDSETNDLDYQIQVAVSATFTSPTIDADSVNNPELFENVPNPANKAPFNSGDTIQFRPSAGLTNGTTYWWRTRAKDTNASNEWGPWSATSSVTIDVSVTALTWFQTTRDQFALNSLSGVTTTADTMTLNVGSTSGIVYGPTIEFSQATLGTAWGQLSFTDVETSSDVKYQIEYYTSTSSWALIPETVLVGNGVGFDTTGVSLLNIDPTIYSTIRVRANLTDAGASPSVNDWAISWGYNVSTPILSKPFDNQKVATRTPSFEWSATDPQNDSIAYQISWSTSPSFTSSTTRESSVNSGFLDLSWSTDTSPFGSGDRIRYTIQSSDILASSTTYYWRVRGRDPAPGADTYSFWSATRSIYVDTTTQVATWYQTDNGQFDTDILSSVYTTGTGSTTVATTTDEIMVAYGEAAVQTPRYRIFNGTTLGTELSALSIGATVQWLVLKASPIIGQYIMGTLGSDRDMNFQVYENGIWANLYEQGTNAPSIARRSLDIAYESLSGRALAVSCNSNPDPNYRIWDGTAWAATGTINLGFTSNCEWVRLASNPITNEIIGLFRNTGNQYEAQVWNATTSTWGNSTTHGSMSEIAHEGMAVEYEASGNQGIIAVSNAGAASFVSNFWNGTAWAGASTTAIGNDFEWGNLRRNAGNDQMALCYVDQDNDIGVKRWSGTAWVVPHDELELVGNGHTGRITDCMFETTPGRQNYIATTYATTAGTGYRYWNTAAWIAEATVGAPPLPTTFTHQMARTSASGTIIGLFFDHLGTDYIFGEHFGTQAWPQSRMQIIENSASVTVAPYSEPFYMASKNPTTLGTIISTPVDFDDGVAPAWRQVLWNATTPGSSLFRVQVEYYTASSTWELIPDSQIAGNSLGTSTSPILITGLDTSLYNVLRLKGNSTCVLGICPLLNEWTIEWAAGVRISGIARENDLTTITTSGTVSIAVGGTLQAGTGLIDANGNWYIDNVTAFPGNVLTVFVDGAVDADEAVAVARYTGPGDAGGMILGKHWVTTGSASTTAQVLTLTDLARFDNSISGDEDIFYDVDAGNDYNNCVVGSCLDSSIYVYSNTLRFSTTSSETVNTWDMRTLGTMYGDTNTIKVSGSWRNLGTFIPNTSTVIFNATSSTRTIDSTGAVSATFYGVTFGESGSVATWNFLSALTATSTFAVNFGTTSPGTSVLTLQGNLSIGAAGTFVKGSATTTFSGSVARTWTDSSASKQDMGNILVDGTSKTVTLASSVRATNITIGSDDTFSAGGANTLFTSGYFNNLGVFTALTGTVDFTATTTGKSINQGASNFYNATFSGVGGAWSWATTNATTTNDFSITGTGTTTLPSGTLAVGGSFNNSAGGFVHNSGEVRLTANTSGKTVRGLRSSWNTLTFAGPSGGWTFADTNATTTGTLSVVSGTPVFPTGILEVGGEFLNSSTFTANGGTLKMTSAAGGRNVTLGASSLANLHISGASTFTLTGVNATATADVMITAGSMVMPTGIFAIGGSFANTGSFVSGTGEVKFIATSGTRTINPGLSSFNKVTLNPASTASLNITAHATTTAGFDLLSGNFIQSSGTNLSIGGIFSNQTGGASTTWTGSTLRLTSGTEYSINSKTIGGDIYENIVIGPATKVLSWNSSASTFLVNATAYFYSQDHAAVDGALNIYGAYTRTVGAEHWSTRTDFDGAALATSSHRIANVRFDSGATANFTNVLLNIVGTSTATTTISRISSGSYGITVASSTINAEYYHFNRMNSTGLNLSGSTTIASMNFGNFELDVNGGTLITIASTTIIQNNTLQIFNVRFALGAAVAGFNVTESDVAGASQFIRFKNHGGNLGGEANDIDPFGNPGNIRWDDSSFIISVSGTVYSDAGATPMTAPVCDDVTPVVTVKVSGGNLYSAPCASGGVGTYTVPGVTFSGETVMTVFLNTNGGAKATLVTKSAAGDLSGVNLYQNRVIVSHEDTFPMSIANMNAYDGGDDSDIAFIAATSGPNTLTVSPETEFWVWTGKTFVPGGNIILNSGGSGNNWDGTFHVDNNAIFTGAGNEAHSVGGRFVVDAGGTFTSASTTFTFTATTSGKVITGISSVTFWNVTLAGVGGNWSVNQNINILGDLLVNAGTLSGGSSVNVSGLNTAGNGTITMTGGTFSLLNGGTLGGPLDWSFHHLTLSGSLGTTTKTASSTVNIAGVLTISANHTLLAGTPSVWNFTGASTPFVVNGTFEPQLSTVRYSGLSATNVRSGTYYRLYIAPSGAGGPTFTLLPGPLTVQSSFIIGDGTNTGTTTLNTNDPTVSVEGETIIQAGSTLVASDTSSLNIYRSLRNFGIFSHTNGTVNFLATSTGHAISMATSSLYNANFNSSSGGWTIVENATTSNNLSLTALSSLTVSSSTTLEVRGTFTNGVGGVNTTWLGSTLYLSSGTAYSINGTTTGSDAYNVLNIGTNTHVRMWNSVATSTFVSASGSLYSQNHNNSTGLLQIYGNYTQSTITDYWSYATDFDGRALGGSSRQAIVRVASSSSVTISGTGALEVYGSPVASTTIDVLTTGAFAFNISGGSTTMGHFSLRNTDAGGLNISGAPVVNSISDADFLLSRNGGSMITVAGATINANPLKILYRTQFATSSGITSGFNVRATGVSASAWRFNIHGGNFAGEAFDSDPGGDPGYVIWDDSAAQINISGNVYGDEGVTPIGVPVCNGVTQNVRLRVQGGGSYASACDTGTGAFSISSIIFNPGNTLSLYLDTAGGARAANISLDPATNISNMHLYRNFVIVRHEQGNPMTISAMDQYDSGNDADVPFTATIGGTNTLSTPAGIGLILWNSKVFAPGGDVTLHANASSSPVDGTIKLYATSTWSAAATQTHRVGGSFFAASGATLAPGNSTFIFNATTTGKLVSATSALTFYNLTLGGVNGEFDISGVGTTSNNLTLTAGTTTLPVGTLVVGGNLDALGAAFLHNSGIIKFTSIATGKTIRANGSSFSQLLFAGSGGAWEFLDQYATTTDSVILTAGTVTIPSRIFAVGLDFDNQSGAFIASASSTLKMTSALSGRIIRFGGSALGGLHVSGGGVYTIPDQNATTTSNVLFAAGTTTLPINSFATFGSFINLATFMSGTSTVSFTATTGLVTINTGSSILSNAIVNGTGQFVMGGNATTTGNFALRGAGAFTLQSGRTLAVGGEFVNTVGGAPTTWTGGTLSLFGGGEYSINSKSLGGDVYDTLAISNGTRLFAWNSASALYTLSATSSLYSQDHNAVDGSLYIFGNYRRLLGTDYWNYATDFDGTALGGTPRQANVRFASGASAYFATGTSLQMLGISTASTTVDRQASGFYGIEVQGGYLNAGFYQLRNTGQTGLSLTGTTTITALNNGDFELGITGGQLITIASTTIDQNASAQYSFIRFATSTGISGANVRRNGTTTSAINFVSEYGNIASEAYDEDGDTACGSIRFTDSGCLQSDQRGYRWRNDDGGEGATAAEWYDQNWTKRKRVRLTNNTAVIATNTPFRFDVTFDSDMQSDFDDLRFTDSSGTTSISYWLESYSASATGTVWVKVPNLPASSFEDVFMYYGNGSVGSASVGTTTFLFFDDFEDGSLSEYTGDTSLFEQSVSFNYERTRGLDASTGNEATGRTTDGIGNMSISTGRDTTFRFYQYIDMTSGGSNEPCVLFGIQSPITLHQNYGVCLSPFGVDKVSIVKNAAYNGRNDGATILATTTVTYTTGWYEVVTDWLTSANRINVNVYTSSGAFFASTSVADSTYTSGSVGFSYWGQHGGWDIPSVRKYISATPTVAFFAEQEDSGATWKAAENATLLNQLINQNTRLRFTVRNTGSTLTNENFRLQVSSKGVSPNCESVPSGNYSDVTTTAGSCGSSPACMTSSSQFANNAQTTQLLTIPTGLPFTQGQILEDPSNQTGNLTLVSGVFTELEYNFQMTAFATQDAYCFRTTKAGVPLDNYSKVAELRILHVPSLSNFSFNNNQHIALVEGATTTIYATSTVTDYNGYADLVNASSTFFRSGLSSSTRCFADNNNCYQVATTSCSFNSCSGNACTVSCRADMYYFADPTDIGSFSTEDWRALIDVWDNSGSHANASSSQELYTMTALTIPAQLNYGSLTVGADSGAVNSTTTVTNTGNSALNTRIYGNGPGLLSGISVITPDMQKFATTTFTYSGCVLCNILTNSATTTPFGLGVPKPTSTSPFFKDVYWGITIPDGTAAATHFGSTTFEAISG